MIAGESGSGKTYSIKNLNPDDVGIFLCEKNRLPFRKQFPAYKVRNMKTDDDKIIALNIGGDDYVEKPYSLGVLLAKVKVMLRRFGSITEKESPDVFEDGLLTVDKKNKTVTVSGEP